MAPAVCLVVEASKKMKNLLQHPTLRHCLYMAIFEAFEILNKIASTKSKKC